MRGIPHHDSPEGQRLCVSELVAQGTARIGMDDDELAEDLSSREVEALMAFYAADRLCRGEIAMKLQLAGLLRVPSWADSVSVARQPTQRGSKIARELREKESSRPRAHLRLETT